MVKFFAHPVHNDAKYKYTCILFCSTCLLLYIHDRTLCTNVAYHKPASFSCLWTIVTGHNKKLIRGPKWYHWILQDLWFPNICRSWGVLDICIFC